MGARPNIIWTKEMDEFLINNANTMTISALADNIGCSAMSITRRLKLLGVKKTRPKKNRMKDCSDTIFTKEKKESTTNNIKNDTDKEAKKSTSKKQKRIKKTNEWNTEKEKFLAVFHDSFTVKQLSNILSLPSGMICKKITELGLDERFKQDPAYGMARDVFYNGKRITKTLCWDCKNARGASKCVWFNGHKPVEGWTAIPTKIKIGWTRAGGKEIYDDSFRVVSCPLFEHD